MHHLSFMLFALLAAPAGPEEPPVYESVVTASRTERLLEDAPVQTLLIGRREIESSGARDLAELLQALPGVEVDSSGPFGSGVQIQGLSSKHVLVLLDGQRISGASGDRLDISRLHLDNVAQVEIVKGPSSSLYGSEAMGGVVHLRTRRAGRPLEGDAKLIGGPSGWDAQASVASASKTALLRLGGGLRQAAPYRLDPSATATTGSGILDGNLNLRGEVSVSPSFTLGLTGSYLHRDLEAVDAGNGRTIFDRRNQVDTIAVSLLPRIDLSESSTLSFTLHTSYTDDRLLQDQRGSSAMDQLQRSEHQVWEAGAQWDQELGTHRFTVGADLLMESLESPRLPSNRGDRFRPALFIQDDWALTETLAVTPGFRLDHDSWFGASFSPKLAARMSPWEPLTFRLSYGHGFRAPGFQEMLLLFENPSVGYVVEGNPELEPERSWGGTAGVSYKPARWLTLDLGTFHHQLENLILATAGSPGGPGQSMRFGYENIGEARSRGIEASAALRPTRAVRLQLGYTFTDARNLTDDRPLDGRARHRATLTASWRNRAGTTATARGEVVGTRTFFPLESGGEVQSEPYAILDLRLSQRLTGNLDLIGGADNVFDAWELDTLPIRPRTYWAGVAMKY